MQILHRVFLIDNIIVLDNDVKHNDYFSQEQVLMSIYDYLQHSRDGKSGYAILVTGHSLGGAVANVFAGEWLPPVAKNNVMCYTFASPIVCSPTKAQEYDAYNIFNIINHSFVPRRKISHLFLSKSCNSRLYLMLYHIKRNTAAEVLYVMRDLGTGTDKRHTARKNVKELRKLVY